jgi:hypothetical protein
MNLSRHMATAGIQAALGEWVVKLFYRAYPLNNKNLQDELQVLVIEGGIDASF